MTAGPSRRWFPPGPEWAMGVGTAVSRLTGLGRLFALSYALGITPLADAYNLANTTPNMVYDLVLGGVLSATLVPVFVARLSRPQPEPADGSEPSEPSDASEPSQPSEPPQPSQAPPDDDPWTAVSAVVTVSTALLAAATVLVVATAGLLVRGYTVFAPLATAGAERAAAESLLRLFAPQVLLYGLIAMGTAVLNSLRRFALPTFAPIANNLVIIAVLLAAAPALRHASVGRLPSDPALLLLLGLGTTAGVVAHLLVVAAGVRRSGARLRWCWQPRHPVVAQVVRLSGWTFGMTGANQAALFAVLLLANTQPGGVSAYTYAYAFFQLPFGVVAASITGARQPSWAAAWAADDIAGLRRQVAGGLRLLVTLMVPIAAVMAALAGTLVRVLLGHGATSGAGAALTGQVLAVLALGLPGFSAYLYFIRVYQAMQHLGSAFRLYLLNNGLTVALAALLTRPFGVQGIAAAVATGYTVAAVAAGAAVRRRLAAAAADEPLVPAPALVRALATGLAAGALAWPAVRWIDSPRGVGALSPSLAAVTVAAVALPYAWAWRHWLRPPGLNSCEADGPGADAPAARRGTGRDSARPPRARAR